MKKLTDNDIEQMANGVFTPDYTATRNEVRSDLHLSKRIPPQTAPLPRCVVLDLHMRTEEESWGAIMDIATSGIRHAKIITGASGILKIKFQQWVKDSLLSQYVTSVTPINNGSFDVTFKKTSPLP